MAKRTLSSEEVRARADRAEQSSAADEPSPVGRPTDYYPSLGYEITELMRTGLSLTAAAAELGIHRQRVYEWEGRFPEFADAVKLARGKRQLFLERMLLGAEIGPKTTAAIFALKNAAPEDWRDKHEVEHSGEVKASFDPASLENLTAEQRGQLRSIVQSIAGEPQGDTEGA